MRTDDDSEIEHAVVKQVASVTIESDSQTENGTFSLSRSRRRKKRTSRRGPAEYMDVDIPSTAPLSSSPTANGMLVTLVLLTESKFVWIWHESNLAGFRKTNQQMRMRVLVLINDITPTLFRGNNDDLAGLWEIFALRMHKPLLGGMCMKQSRLATWTVQSKLCTLYTYGFSTFHLFT